MIPAGIVRVRRDRQQRAEAAALGVQLLDLVHALRRIADDPQVVHQVVRGHRLVGHGGVELGGRQLDRTHAIGELMPLVVPAQHRAGALAGGGRRGRHEHVAGDPPLARSALRPALAAPASTSSSGGADTGATAAELVIGMKPRSPPSAWARLGRAGRHRDRRMGLLVRLHVVAAVLDRIEDGVSMSKNFPWWLKGPSEAQSLSTTSSTSAERARTPAGSLRRARTAPGRSGWRHRRCPTETARAPCDRAWPGGAPGTRVVQRQRRHAGAEPYLRGQRQRLGDEQIGRRRVLPALGQMLAHPGLPEAEPIGQHDLVDVALVAVGERPMGRVQRHHEQAELHGQRFSAGVDVAGPMPQTWMTVSSFLAPSSWTLPP